MTSLPISALSTVEMIRTVFENFQIRMFVAESEKNQDPRVRCEVRLPFVLVRNLAADFLRLVPRRARRVSMRDERGLYLLDAFRFRRHRLRMHQLRGERQARRKDEE